MTKDLLTQAAQKEAEGLVPLFDIERARGLARDRYRPFPSINGPFLSNTALNNRRAFEKGVMAASAIYETERRAAHVKCALLYSERAAGLVEAIDSAAKAMHTWPGDWSEDHRLAWIYGILNGWDDALDEVAEKHGWDADTVGRLRRFRAALHAYNQKP